MPRVARAVCLAAVGLGVPGCGGPAGVAESDFPPTQPIELTLHDGLVLRASAEVVGEAPTVLRISATLTNPTDATVVAQLLVAGCQVMAVAYWQARPGGQIVEPPNGLLPAANNSPCVGFGTRDFPVGAGQTAVLDEMPEFVLSEVLGQDFIPGRFMISALVIDAFDYEVLAGDFDVPN